MKVTVLLTSYNAGKFLRGAIQSVEEQTYTDWELVVLDDGSTDPAVPPILDDANLVGHQVHRFWPTVEERRAAVRYAVNINWGVQRSAGDVVTYLCGDDYYLPDRLERMTAKLAEGHDVVYGGQILLNEYGRMGCRATRGVLDDAYYQVDLNSVAHTRESFLRAGGFPIDPSMYRDADAHFWRRLTDAGYVFHPVDGGPTDAKRYRAEGVDARVVAGLEPWAA